MKFLPRSSKSVLIITDNIINILEISQTKSNNLELCKLYDEIFNVVNKQIIPEAIKDDEIQ